MSSKKLQNEGGPTHGPLKEGVFESPSASDAPTPSLPLAMAELGWRLALAVILPILGGIQLDAFFDIKPALSIVGFFISIGLAALVTYRYVHRYFPETFRKQR